MNVIGGLKTKNKQNGCLCVPFLPNPIAEKFGSVKRIPFSIYHTASMFAVMSERMRALFLLLTLLAVYADASAAPSGWNRRRRIIGITTKQAVSLSLARAADHNPIYAAVTASRRRRRPLPQTTELPATPLSIPQRLVAGGCSRGIAQAIMYPMDALRTLAQTRDGRTLKDVGASALLRGCAQTSSFAVFIGAIQFAIFGATRDKCGPLVSSALGAAGSCLVSIPQEVIKQRLVTGVYTSFRSAVQTIYKTEGVLGFYSAWKPTVARNVPFVIATFTAMDALKEVRLQQKRRTHGDDADHMVSLTFAENLVIGISSSLIGATLTHPGKCLTNSDKSCEESKDSIFVSIGN